MLRRVIALAVGVLLIILLLLAVRGCLNARKERGFESYASDLETIVEQSNQLSTEFFTRLEDPSANGGGDSLELEAQIASDRGTAESLYQRVEGLDTPDELADAQVELAKAFELRRDALAGIAEDIPTALGNEGRQDALEGIAADMRAFVASDVLFGRAHADIVSTLDAEGINVDIPESVFLQDPADWIDTVQLATILSTFATDSGATEGIHGLAVIGTTINKTPLTAGAETSVPLGSGPPTIKVEVENQGDQEESEVSVAVTLSGGVIPIDGEDQIPTLDAGGREEVSFSIDQAPDTDTALTLDVQVLPVPGEADSSNNEASYTVIFD